MNEVDDDLAGLRDLRGTLDDAIEILALFLSAAAGARIPTEAMVDAAHQVVGDLAEWRATLEDIAEREDDGQGLH
jgi:hypothetical protein